jgi:retron-type reverse transcriptase
VLNLTALWLKAGRKYRNQPVGVPLGAVLSPLWANLYLHPLDAWISSLGFKMVRYADDFLVLCAEEAEVIQARQAVEAALSCLKLSLAPEKTRITHFDQGFLFLGVTFHKDTYAYTWEQKKIQVKGRQLNILYKHLPEPY